MVHAAMAAAQPGDVLVLTMPEPAPVALFGDLLATQAQRARRRGGAGRRRGARRRGPARAGAAGVGALGARARRGRRTCVGAIDVPVMVGGAEIRPGDVVVLDADGVAVVAAERVDEVLDGGARPRGEGARQARAAAGRRAVLRPRRAAGDRGRRSERDRPPRPGRAAHPEAPTESLTLLRRRARDGGRGAARASPSTCAAGATTSATRSSSPSRDTSGMALPRAARVEPGGARAARRRGRGDGARRGLDRRRPRPRARPTASATPTATRSSCTSRPSATRRPSTCARR